ncbi:MAG: hypothetical protein AAF724_05680 [Pseudomonadota bacterium]
MSKRDGDSDFVAYDGWNNITLPKRRADHLDLWAQDTFDRLSDHTLRQRQRQRQLEGDLDALMKTFDDLSDTYLEPRKK